ncbi:protease modulator HflC [Telmatocola sphagniphila]|uniref:Protein HflC n=1 Tax=Telmatocola sphagniphila TaxID=1123043 RepID=A0A8E6B516_9BACT|nr:protease modulator HflC [Telmatocola sphagniphila]QVL32052.1 protease modulator HflC [Telmatocola sphagniphila]
MTKLRLLILTVILLVLGFSSLYKVDQTEFAYVTRFGEPVVTYDGSTDAGLHFKLPWPIDSVLRIDRRLQVFDLPPTESLTRDPQNQTVDKTLLVDAYVCWKIPDSAGVDKFIRAVGSPEQARRLLSPRFSSRLAAVISNMPLDNLIQVADVAKVDQRNLTLKNQLLGIQKLGPSDTAESLPSAILREYGIEIVDARLRRFNYPEAVRDSIAERIRSERGRKVADYQSEGDRRYREIVSTAERDARKILAEAQAEKARIEGKADAEADQIRNAAHSQDREFYTFLQKLKAYQSMLSDTRDYLLLSTKNELFDLLLKPPPVKK